MSTGCKRRPSLSMNFAAWPKEDQALWRNAERKVRFAICPAPLSTWSDVQRQTAARHYGLWLRYLEVAEPKSLSEPPGARMIPSRFGQFFSVRHAEVSVSSLAKYVCDLYGIMLSLAPDQDWQWLKQMRRLIGTHAKRVPAKSRTFTHARELVRVGRELITAAFDEQGNLRDPVTFRDGLIILTLILVPVRITQFSLIRLDEHLVQQDHGERFFHWEAEETKTRRESTHPLCEELVELLLFYIEEVRPLLLNKARSAAGTTALWIGVSGRSISAQVLRKVIETRTKAVLGYKVNPHAFRASAASSYAIDDPARARDASALLDHADSRTTERYYLIGQREQSLVAAHAALRKVRQAKRPAAD